MIDNKLDFIFKLKPQIHEEISRYCQLYIELDSELTKLGECQIGHRNLAIARTDLEQSLMNVIKVLILQGEIK